MEKKTIGIIGGMGPLATVDLFGKIVAHTAAGSDNGHAHVLIDNNTAIPDRTKSIIGDGESPLPELVKSAERLRAAGADFLIMPCNTAHYYYAPLAESIDIPVLNMLELTVMELERRGITRIGLLATDGTIKTGIYEILLSAHGIVPMKPSAEGQKAIMSMIYDGIKAGAPFDTHDVRVCLDSMSAAGAEAFVLGCTELPLAFLEYQLDYPVVDPTLVLAKAAIRYAGYEVKD